jgi:hypothetical protein
MRLIWNIAISPVQDDFLADGCGCKRVRDHVRAYLDQTSPDPTLGTVTLAKGGKSATA